MCSEGVSGGKDKACGPYQLSGCRVRYEIYFINNNNINNNIYSNITNFVFVGI